MDPRVDEVVSRLGSTDRPVRLAAAETLGELIDQGELRRQSTAEVNNHVHTIYSFSPYTPSAAAFMAWKAGLLTVGAMDHDSVAGCEEMLDSAKSLGIASTVGFELRVNMSGTALEGRKFNNPDSSNIAYITFHGIPRRSIPGCVEFLEPVPRARNVRNRRMVERINELTQNWGIDPLSFESIYNLSLAATGGSITERHLMHELAKRVVDHTGRGEGLLRFLEEVADLRLPKKIGEYLTDESNPHFLYDLLGLFKSSLIGSVYVQPDETECIGVKTAIEFAESIGAIAAYPYLGDVTDSPTGDKKAEQFEDGFLDQLFDEIDRLGFRAVTYMPPRNTREQLSRVQELCRKHALFEISGVDINSSRQSFNCPEILEPIFVHLTKAAWALIAHEKISDRRPELGLFDPRNPLIEYPLSERVECYASFGAEMDPREPEGLHLIASETIPKFLQEGRGN